MITRLGAYGGPRQLYGSFEGKDHSAIPDFPVFLEGLLATTILLEGRYFPTVTSLLAIWEPGVSLEARLSSNVSLAGTWEPENDLNSRIT